MLKTILVTMSIASQRRISEESKIKIEDKPELALMRPQQLKPSQLRKLCTNECLRKGDNLSKEEKICLTSCYRTRSHQPNLNIGFV